MTHWPI